MTACPSPDLALILAFALLVMLAGIALGLRLGFKLWRKTYVQADRIGIYRAGRRRPF